MTVEQTFSFVAGGALRSNDPSYVRRLADQKAEQAARQDKYWYVTAPRQMGKTSLFNRIKAQLSGWGWLCVSIDLATLKRLDTAAWFDAFGQELGRQLKIAPYPQLRNQIDFKTFLLDRVGLAQANIRLAIFFDEIEGLLSCPFSDEFLMVLRDLYNQREGYAGSFVAAFAGAVDAQSLVKDHTISPFNVAESITLEDFTETETYELTRRLELAGAKVDPAVHHDIFSWTHGQPYLTQRICWQLAEWLRDKKVQQLDSDVIDRVVNETILNPMRRDTNVTHVLGELEKLKEPAKELWQQMLSGTALSPYQAGLYALYLTGAVCTTADEQVVIRNRVYEKALKAVQVEKKETVTHSPAPDIPRELLEQLQKGNLVLFCGAGISMSNGGLPSGWHLGQELAQRANLGDVGRMTLPEIAQAYANKMGIQSLISYIVWRIDNPRYQPLRTHELIAELPFKYVVSTNWDNLQERAFERAGKRYIKAVNDSEIAFADEQQVLMLKTHGSIEQKESIVVLGDDYYHVLAQRPSMAGLLQSYFTTKTILFLGFGLADEDFKRLYLEVTRNLGRYKRRSYAVQLNPSPHMPEYWLQHNVQIISADATKFLEELKQWYVAYEDRR